MHILAVPNWSSARNSEAILRARASIQVLGLNEHYFQGDFDHNRTVTAFSGIPEAVFEAVLRIARVLLPVIDLRIHQGVHPLVGAMDVCPFVCLEGDEDDVIARTRQFAHRFATEFEIPVMLYEKAELGRHAKDLPSLRRGGFQSLAGIPIGADYGPEQAHRTWGVSVIGVRDFMIACNINFDSGDAHFVKTLAAEIRRLRKENDPRFDGVRALGFELPTRGLTQLSLNLTKPDIAPFDTIFEYASHRGQQMGVRVDSTELIGVIRQRDLEHSRDLPVRKAQIVDNVFDSL